MSLMKELKVLESVSKHNLPDELWFEILSWLPVKSLLRFRCVSKTWQSTVSDPIFCRRHLNRFKYNLLEPHLFVAQRKGYKCKEKYIVRSSVTFKPTATLHPPDIARLGNKRYISYSMDGLVLLKYYTPTLEVMLWNPSIRKARVLPPSPVVITEGMRNVDMGFGFNSLVKDYKLLRLVQQHDNSLHSVAIYTVGTGLWKTIKFQGKGISDWCWHFECGMWRTVCFRGRLYFIAEHLHTKDWELVSFDLSNEVFAAAIEPSSFDPIGNFFLLKGVTTVLGGRLLGLIYLLPDECCIWVSQPNTADFDFMQWTKHFIFITPIPHFDGYGVQHDAPDFLYLGKSGDILLQWTSKWVTSCNLMDGEEKTLLKTRRLDMNMVCGYIESLVLLNG